MCFRTDGASCVATNTPGENEHALDQMHKVLKAGITPSTELDLEQIRTESAEHQSSLRG